MKWFHERECHKRGSVNGVWREGNPFGQQVAVRILCYSFSFFDIIFLFFFLSGAFIVLVSCTA